MPIRHACSGTPVLGCGQPILHRMNSSTDESELVTLMVAYQNGDLGAFERLYALLADEVRRYFAKRHRDGAVANDLLQDMFLEMHRSRRTYTPPLAVRPWIFGIARNVSARSRRATQFHPISVDALVGGESPSAESLDVEHALATLPSSTREPWLMHHLLGFSFDSIAARLGITVMAAKLRSSRATRALRFALSGSKRGDPQ